MSQTKAQLVDAVDGSIVAADLASNSVTTAKVVDAAITADKLIFPVANRNLIINGAMQVAQRGTSSTSSAYATIDRFQTGSGNIGQNVTQSQQSLSSTDTGPYGAGFRKFKRAQLAAAGNANANAYVEGAMYAAEAQDIANSGWDFTSSSSFITLSFWFRCSTNQAFMLNLRSEDGTARMYSTTFTASGNNTWTKITKTIPGNTSPTVAIDDNNGAGLKIFWGAFYGTDYTDSGSTMDAWKTYSGSSQGTDMASTWLTAGASTFDVTGVQLEVGSTATDFEHRSFAQELQLCKRYYQQINQESSGTSILTGFGNGSGRLRALLYLPVEMRANPTVALDVNGGNPTFYSYTGGSPSYSSLSGVESTKKNIVVDINTSSLTAGAPYDWRGSSAFITIASEL